MPGLGDRGLDGGQPGRAARACLSSGDARPVVASSASRSKGAWGVDQESRSRFPSGEKAWGQGPGEPEPTGSLTETVGARVRAFSRRSSWWSPAVTMAASRSPFFEGQTPTMSPVAGRFST